MSKFHEVDHRRIDVNRHVPPARSMSQEFDATKELIAETFQAQVIMDRAAKTNTISDASILKAASLIDYPAYENGRAYKVGEIIQKGGLFYEIKAAHTSHATAYPVETTFAYYRLIELTHAGTLQDPIPYPETSGIVVAVVLGKHYSYKGKAYLAKADLPNCVWPPDSGIWQWEVVK